MKKIPLLIILTCLVLSGCNGNTENLITDSNFDSNTVTVDETAESTSDYINTEIIETTAQTNQDVTAKDIISVNEFEYLDVENIKAEQYVSQSETLNNPFFPVGFYSNDIYVLSEYYTLVSAENSNLEMNTVKKFNLESKEVVDIASYEFDIAYDPDLCFKNHYFTFPCVYDEKGKLTISVTAANMQIC